MRTTGILLTTVTAQYRVFYEGLITGINKPLIPSETSPTETLQAFDSMIRIGIWNRTKVGRFVTHDLAGGGSHKTQNLGYAFRWETTLHGNAVEYGKQAIPKFLLDKIARQ